MDAAHDHMGGMPPSGGSVVPVALPIPGALSPSSGGPPIQPGPVTTVPPVIPPRVSTSARLT